VARAEAPGEDRLGGRVYIGGCPGVATTDAGMQSFDEATLTLLHDVLERRHCYGAVAAQLGVARSTVARRIKGLVRRLADAGALDGLRRELADDLAAMRREGARIVRAARTCGIERDARPVVVLDDEEIARGVERLLARGRSGKRDAALVCTLLCTGLKPVELARLQVRDYLLEDGEVRTLSTLRAEAAVNGVARPLLFGSLRAVRSLDAYLEERARRGLGTGAPERYRGLDPASRLFLTASGKPFVVTRRSPGDPRPVCKRLLATLRAAFERAGWAGMTAHQARRHVALALQRQGAGAEQLQLLLGLKSARSVRRLTAGARPPQQAALGPIASCDPAHADAPRGR
jgi:integrase